VTEEDCTTEALSARLNGVAKSAKYLTRLTNQLDCESQKICRGPALNGALTTGLDDDFASLTEEQCAQNSKWSYESLYRWEPDHTWAGGRARKAIWTNYTAGPRWTKGTIFDFEKFTTAYQTAISALYNQRLQSFLFCQHSRSTQFLSKLVCSCLEKRNYTLCDQLYNDSLISDIGTYCGGYADVILAPPFTFAFSEESSDDTDCHTIYFLPRSIYSYLDSSTKPFI